MVETAVFLLGSGGFILLSRQAFRHPYSHGFPRFFAFEALLGMAMLNARNWFLYPFSPLQIISWVFLALAVYLAIHSFWSLHKHGAHDPSRQDSDRIGIEKTSRLVTAGPYRVIRHPMYTSLLYLAGGLMLKHPDLVSILLAIIASLTFFLTAVYEEKENLYYLGDEYASYMRRTKRFIPFIF